MDGAERPPGRAGRADRGALRRARAGARGDPTRRGGCGVERGAPAALRLLVAPPELVPGERSVRGDDYHYLFHVRRLRPGDRLVLFDGEGCEAEATVKAIAARSATLAV